MLLLRKLSITGLVPFSVSDMETVRLKTAELKGCLTAPVSKSYAHRAEICAFLAGTELKSPALSDDIKATKNALKALRDNEKIIDCGESGSTLRFLIPIAAALDKAVAFTGSASLSERPLTEYLRLLPEHGVKCEYNGVLPLSISGRLMPGKYKIRGDISSQFISGLMFALPLLDNDSEIILLTPLQSKPYADMTVKTLSHFGITINENNNGYYIKGNQTYIKSDYAPEGDWSQAAFFLAGGALTGDVTVGGLNMKSLQGDREIVSILRLFGADVTVSENSVRVKKSSLVGIETDVSNTPDLAPVIAVLAAFAKGKTVIRGGKRLRFKESDRISSVVNNLKKMGVNAVETPCGMEINGGCPHGALLDGYNDHRVVMAFSIAAAAAEGETEITEPFSVNKSYPEFFSDYLSSGGNADVINNR